MVDVLFFLLDCVPALRPLSQRAGRTAIRAGDLYCVSRPFVVAGVIGAGRAAREFELKLPFDTQVRIQEDVAHDARVCRARLAISRDESLIPVEFRAAVRRQEYDFWIPRVALQSQFDFLEAAV